MLFLKPVEGAENIFGDEYSTLNGCYALVQKLLVNVSPIPTPAPVVVDGISFPARVSSDQVILSPVDLRLPEGNPLITDDSPLQETAAEICKVFNVPRVQYPVLIGSSGVGKTTTAFLVAQQRFCILMELVGSAVPGSGYHVDFNTLLLAKLYEDIQRRIIRQVVARALILAHLKNQKPNLTPYDWLLFQLSEDMQIVEDVLDLSQFSENVSQKVVKNVSKLIGQELCVIVDEAHHLNAKKQFQYKGQERNAYQCTLFALGRLSIGGVLSLGTQVGLQQALRVYSVVGKSDESQSQAYVFGKYPVLHRVSENVTVPTVWSSISRCIAQPDQMKSTSIGELLQCQLQGRCRWVASFVSAYVHVSLQDPSASVENRLNSAWIWFNQVVSGNRSLYPEIVRVVDGYETERKVDMSHLFDLFVSFLVENPDAEGVACRSYPGTLVATEYVIVPATRREFSTGYMLTVENRKASFHYFMHEEMLMHGLRKYLINTFPVDFHERTLHALQRSTIYGYSASARGQGLDEVVMLRVLMQSQENGISIAEFFKWEDAQANLLGNGASRFSVKYVLGGGKGMFFKWLEHVVDRQKRDTFWNGIAWRNYAVKPDVLAGADGAFVAYDSEQNPIIVLVACAWYNDGITLSNRKSQYKTSDLLQQYENKAALRSNKVVQLRSQILKLIHESDVANLQVMVELPQRSGTLPLRNVDGNAFVIDRRNYQAVLGIDANFSPLKECGHTCGNKDSCKHSCCKRMFYNA